MEKMSRESKASSSETYRVRRCSFLAFSIAVLSCATDSCSTAPPPDDGHPCTRRAEPSASLGSLAEARGLWVGNFLFNPDPDPAFQRAIGEFDMYTLPVFFNFVEPVQGAFNFALPDAVADAAP